jgi:hypothetical protein
MIVYISGPITGIENNNCEAFYAKEREISKLGNVSEVINPIKIAAEVDYEKRFEQYPPSWSDYMRACIKKLCEADYIVFLPGSENSKGSILEREIAEKLSIEKMQIKDGIIDWRATYENV